MFVSLRQTNFDFKQDQIRLVTQIWLKIEGSKLTTDLSLFTSFTQVLTANNIVADYQLLVSKTRDLTPLTDKHFFTWLWRWFPLGLSKCQSPVLFTTTLTWIITLDKLLILLGSNHLKGQVENYAKWTKCVCSLSIVFHLTLHLLQQTKCFQIQSKLSERTLL